MNDKAVWVMIWRNNKPRAAALAAVLLLGTACREQAGPAADTGAADSRQADAPSVDAPSVDAAAVDVGIVSDLWVRDIVSDLHPSGAPPAIDGLLDDWQGVPVLATDPKGDASGGFDVTTVRAVSRGTKVFLQFDVGKELNASAGPASEGTLTILLTLASSKRLTMDLRKLQAFTGVAPGTAVKWTTLDYRIAPTHASKVFESRFDLGAVGARAGETVTLDFGGSDSLAKPAILKLDQPVYTPATRSAARAKGATFRVASLNTWANGLSDAVRGPKLKRLLKAAAADVYCFQEESKTTAATIASALTALDPLGDGATWSAVKVSDDVVATRGSVLKVPGESAGDRFVGAAITLDGRRLVVYSVHPRCCGHIGHLHDTLRIVEMQTLAAAIKKLRAGAQGAALLPWRTAPVVVAGDWNLVGSRKPLDTMLDSKSGPGLRLHLPRHLRGSDVHTWYRDKVGTYPPGLLDLLVYSPDLNPLGGFVLDTADLDSATLAKLGLQAGDSAASDHLLLASDLAVWGR